MIFSLSLAAHHALSFIWKFFAFHPSIHIILTQNFNVFLVFLKSCQSCNKNVEIIFKKSTPPLTTNRKIIPKNKNKIEAGEYFYFVPKWKRDKIKMKNIFLNNKKKCVPFSQKTTSRQTDVHSSYIKTFSQDMLLKWLWGRRKWLYSHKWQPPTRFSPILFWFCCCRIFFVCSKKKTVKMFARDLLGKKRVRWL